MQINGLFVGFSGLELIKEVRHNHSTLNLHSLLTYRVIPLMIIPKGSTFSLMSEQAVFPVSGPRKNKSNSSKSTEYNLKSGRKCPQ